MANTLTRSIRSLPGSVDPKQIKASCKDGVVALIIPVAEGECNGR